MKKKFLSLLADELSAWGECIFVKNVPGRIGASIRRFYWARRLGSAGYFNISEGCIITNPESICLGEATNIHFNCCLYAHNGGKITTGLRVRVNSNVMLGAADNGTIIIGNDVLIGPNVVIRASNHNYLKKETPINRQGHAGGKIVIEDDVWIGANCAIVPNVTIGKGAIIGAGAVVVNDVAPYSMAGGVPAVTIKKDCRTESK